MKLQLHDSARGFEFETTDTGSRDTWPRQEGEREKEREEIEKDLNSANVKSSASLPAEAQTAN